MIYVDLVLNLALLVALSVVSGFIDGRWPRSTRFGVLLQGALFGCASVIGMLYPLNMGSGLIFDGRSVMISLCALFFGPWAASVTVLMTIPCRLGLGGVGMIMGVLIILSSAGIGLVAHFRLLQAAEPPSTRNLYFFGLAVHLVMVALMLTLPGNISLSVMKRIGIPVILLYPLATILVGKILSDQVSAIQYIEALRRSEEKFSKTFETNPIATAVSTLQEGRFLNVNDAFLEGFSFSSKEELIGKTSLELGLFADPHDRQIIRKAVEETGRVHNIDLDMVAKDGRVLACLFSAEPISVNNEHCWLTTALDITERKQAGEAIRESEEKFSKIFQMSPHSMAISKMKDGIYHEVNSAFLSLTGFTREEVIGRSSLDLNLWVDPELRERIREEIGLGKEEKLVPVSLQTKSGEVLKILYSAVNIHIGGIPYLLSMAFDVTAQKRAEEEIHRLNEELEQKIAGRTDELRKTQLALLSIVDDLNASTKNIALVNQALEATNKELESFSYSVSHDLRAPLRSIDGFSNALLEDYHKKLDAKGKNYLKRVRQATQHMGMLIDDILKLSRVITAEFMPKSVDVSKMVQDILLTVRQNDPARNVKVSIQKGIIIDGDRHMLEIALTNLIDNAWKFTGKTKNARIEFGTILKEGKKVFFIRDNGAGFDMSYVNKLFGTFQRLHTNDEFTGTGIGLATVQRIINRHGGKIWAEGEVGKGATFYFTFPE